MAFHVRSSGQGRRQDRTNPRNLECRLCHPQKSIETKLAPGNTVYGMGIDPRGYDKISAGCDVVVQESVDHIWLDVTPFLGERVAGAEDVKTIPRGARCYDVRFSRVEPSTKLELDTALLRPSVQYLVDRVPLAAPHEQIVGGAVQNVAKVRREPNSPAHDTERLDIKTYRAKFLKRINSPIIPNPLRMRP